MYTVAEVYEVLNKANVVEVRGYGLWLTEKGVPLTFVTTTLFPELSFKYEASNAVFSKSCVPEILGNMDVGGVKLAV